MAAAFLLERKQTKTRTVMTMHPHCSHGSFFLH
jgi:hypothetical protein